MTKVAMIGVGKLGQACAEVMADTYPLVGYDVAPREPKNFPMVDSVKDAVEYADIVFVAAPTPHDPNYDGRQPAHHLPNKDFDYTIVKSILIATSDRPEIKIDWRIYTKNPDNPLIRDLIIEGLSLARTQKEEFASILNSNDGDINTLYEALEKFANN